ncbi:MAG: hypothetical protein AUJ47_05245 [Candidatus Marinimicrobia bacterium CG1_02_48_14]|nr:MAG: hypothetical protein AUJ47_05245 [Candidatus Marinimicrobia bacterium CG1_02_48_14]
MHLVITMNQGPVVLLAVLLMIRLSKKMADIQNCYHDHLEDWGLLSYYMIYRTSPFQKIRGKHGRQNQSDR